MRSSGCCDRPVAGSAMGLAMSARSRRSLALVAGTMLFEEGQAEVEGACRQAGQAGEAGGRSRGGVDEWRQAGDWQVAAAAVRRRPAGALQLRGGTHLDVRGG